MSTLDHQDQICYVQCGLCTIILVVSVPSSCLSMVRVPVRCGRCMGILSVNMTKASFAPLRPFPSLNQAELKDQESCPEEKEAQEAFKNRCLSMVAASNTEDGDIVVPTNPVINKHQEKRKRPSTAYNNFIREEIRRLKAQCPNMTHKEAFRLAPKNWALHRPKERGKELQ
ncbi:axial regulator YABBY 4 [Malania oleifera]|uniref:axial regulator YABBY 4 n=1 Tax=Malania oleifera TaxID=397392 RepID=UPI0025AE3BF1|nr:axial regulator YABBY 4 [Malania oleifera]